MPTINNTTVTTGTGLSTAGNGGRKLVRLLNGALISAVRTSTTSWQLHKSLNNGSTWSQLVTITEAVNDVTLATKGNDIHVTVSFSTSGVKHYRYNDSGVLQGTAQNVDTGQTAMGAVSTAINDAGTELHAAWSSKNSTYPNSFNIRYAKGMIAADGSVTWGAVEQLSSYNSTPQYQNPVVIVRNNTPSIICSFNNNTIEQRILFITKEYLTREFSSNMNTNWGNKFIYTLDGYTQFSPCSLFIPQSINGLANGRLWVAWHGKDATDSAKFNIRTSYSDDGGATWATPTKQTTGNLYDQMNASLTADAQGKVLLTWDAQNATTTQTALKVFNGTWGATTTLTGDGYTNASTLFDNAFKLAMTTPPIIRQSTSGIYFSGNYSAGASVSPLSSALGDKTAPSVLSYTVTPESGSTITSIVEKVNGTTVNTYSNPASLSRTFTIPLANWDALKYYNTHTISVTVTDSNGMANTQTYTFNKTLANDASLLEGAKAAKDGKDRISTKRDVLAGQVGLAAGSTFDAISAQLASGNAFKKFQPGVSTSNTNGVITITSLSFKPALVFAYPNNPQSDYRDTALLTSLVSATNSVYINNSNQAIGYTLASLTDTGFTIRVQNINSSYNWIAFG